MHSELISALRDPDRYPHPVDQVELLETHISWVLLAGDWVYKIKKPVDFGFLDFSSLASREHFCREELRLNRRHAAELYDALVTITGSPSKPLLGGDGPPIEYAVRMRRFDADSRFDQLLAGGQLQARHMDELAAELAALHRIAEPAAEDSDFGQPDQVIAPMRDNFTVLFDLVDQPARREQLERLSRWTEAQFDSLAELIAERRRDGFVRECHGDVHLGNVALYQGQTILFDCLEFSPELRWTDVMADLAFAVMDLRERGAEALSWRLLDRYLAETGDYPGLALLAFYAVYRAMVRAKVAAISRADADAAGRQRLERELDQYLGLAEGLARGRQTVLVLTCGVSGSGKSWLAERLLEQSGLVRLRSDVERKRLHGLAPGANSESGLASGLYSAAASEQTYARLADLSQAVLEAGYPVLVDATFLKRAQRERFAELARAHGVPFGIVACEADLATLEKRVQSRCAAGTDASEADLAVLERQLGSVEPCTSLEGPCLRLETAQAQAVEQAADWLGQLASDG